MQKESISSMHEEFSTQHDISSVVAPAIQITELDSSSKKTNKRDFSDSMETEEQDTTRTPKNQNIEKEGQLAHVTKDNIKGKISK